MAGNASSVWLDIIARDKASRELAKVGAKVAAFAAAVKVFGIDSVKAYADAEQSQLQLQDAFKRFPKLADSSYAALTQYNNALQAKTQFDDDAIASAQGFLARLDLTGRQLEQITPLMLDYAAATGQTAEEASSKLGKALLGNAKALKATGVNFVATGDRVRDFNALMDLLSQKVGGFAEEQGKTAAGQLQILKNQFGDLQETVGEALVPALQTTVKVMTGVLAAFNGMPKPLKDTTLFIAGVGATALIVVPKVVALRNSLRDLNLSMSTLVKFKGPATAALAAIIPVMAMVADEAGKAESAVDGMKSALETGDKASRLRQELKILADEMPGFWKRLGDPLSGSWWSSIERADEVLKRTGVTLEDVDSRLSLSEGAWVSWKAGVLDAALANGASEQSMMNLGRALDRVYEAYNSGQGSIGTASALLGDFADTAGDAGDEVDDLYDSLTKFNDTFIDSRQAAIDVRDSLAGVVDALKESKGSFDINTEAGRKAQESALRFAQDVDKQAQAMIDAKKPASEIAKLYDTQRQNLYNTMIQMGLSKSEAKLYADQLLRIPKNLTTNVKMVTTATGDTWVWSSGIIGRGRAWKPSEIGVGASGGVVTRPTLAVIGEAGPEAVVPLSRTRGSSPLPGITININGPVLDQVSAARWIRDALAAGRRAGVTI